MPRPKKTLLERVREGTFRPDRHGDLLADEQLPATPLPGWQAAHWRKLLATQAEYDQARSRRERSSVAYAFAELANERPPASDWTVQQWLLATCGIGLEQAQKYAETRRVEFADGEAELWAKWLRWDKRHGLLFRARAGRLHNGDKIALHWWVRLEREENLDAIDAILPELLAAYLEDPSNVRRRPPPPPGWDLLTS